MITDMAAGKPMDRLVCGDVGFGKTEVALRAAYAAVADNKQVVMLCPTTLLAEQHFQTFSDRFADWPARSRSYPGSPARRASETVRKLASGEIDIVIGTHKLLSREVKLKRLGLVIIDEEHRFGVRQKEALKKLRAEVDVLTLTATPIPRTLAMSLEGIRDFSVIATAPEKRLGDQDLRRALVGGPDPRGGDARAAPRRRGLLPAQRGRLDRAHEGAARQAAAGSAHRGGPRPDARARPGA